MSDRGRSAERAGGNAGVKRKPASALTSILAAQDDLLSHCVHCGFCLPACPTYTRLGDEADSPRGRLHLMGAVVEGRLDPASDAFQRHLDRCLGCRACESVCPSGVEYGLLLESARAVAVEARPPGLLQRALLGAIARPVPFRLWMWASRLARATGVPALMARVLPDRGLLAQARLGSAMLAASAPARSLGKGGVRERAEGQRAEPGSRGRVGMLTGCVQDQLFGRVNAATRRILRANGWEVVEIADQGCCGALHAHGGRLDQAAAMARRNVAVFRAAGVDRIAATAAGCGAAMRAYTHLLQGEDDEGREAARWFADRVRDVSELVAAEGYSPRRGAAIEERVAYDPPCHLLHGQRVSDPPMRMLEAIPGLELSLLEGAEECCGGAGIYGITHPELGGWIGNDKVEAVRRSGAKLVVTGNPGCIMQIGAGVRLAGLDVEVLHPVELLDESYRRGGLYP